MRTSPIESRGAAVPGTVASTRAQRRRRTRTMHAALVPWSVLAWLLGAFAGGARAEDALSKRDRQGPVTVAVALLAPPKPGSPVTARVVLDTHSVSLDEVAFERAVALRKSDGSDEAPTAVERATGTGHHREAVVVFSLPEAISEVRIVVKDVGGVPERVFAWPVTAAR